MKPIIEFKNFTFTYDGNGTDSLKNVNLSILPGEVILLTGKSGCGKTTITRCINGLIPDFFEGEVKGRCTVFDMDITEHETGDYSAKIGSVFQDPRSQFFTLHVKTEIPFPSENLGTKQAIIQKQYCNAVERFEIQGLLSKSIFDLSSGEKQKVALASVYTAGVSVYVLDEPSANLDAIGAEQLKSVLTTLKEQGHTIIVSEHKLYYLKDLADRVVVLRHGKIKEILTGKEFSAKSTSWFHDNGLRQINLRQIHPKLSDSQVKDNDTQIQAENLKFCYRGKPLLWKNVSFTAKGGEVIGILGKNGSGKSTMIRVLMGLDKPKVGKIAVNGRYASKQVRRKKSFYVMQDVDYQLFAGSVLEEMLAGGKDTEKKRQKALAVLEHFELQELADRHPSALSGGQKQRLSIALAYMSDAPFLYLDEPTSGLDATNMHKVQQAIQKFAEDGRCVFVITHDYEFAVSVFTSLLIINEGGSVHRISPEQYQPTQLYQYFNNKNRSENYE